MRRLVLLTTLAVVALCACQPTVIVPVPSRSSARAPTPVPASSSSVPALDLAPVDLAGLTDADHGWVLTRGALLLTDDGGSTWHMGTVPTVETGRGVLGVAFADANAGWLGTLDSNDPRASSWDMWRTADGARTWTRVRVPFGTNEADTMGSISFSVLDRQHVLAMVQGGMPNGYTGDLYTTADGGETWTLVGSRRDTGITGPIGFATQQSGVVSGGAAEDRVFVTADGGRTWSRAFIPNARGTGVQVREAATFWSGTDGGLFVIDGDQDGNTVALVVVTTRDGGSSWAISGTILQPSTPRNDYVTALRTPAEWTVWLTATTFDRTVDGGVTWTELTSRGLPETPDSLRMPTETRGWALVPGRCEGGLSFCERLFSTSDGGLTWNALNPG